MSSNSDPIFRSAKGTDALRGQAAGAPLRAIGSLAAIWILARAISWNIPADIVTDPLGPTDGTTKSRGVTYVDNIAGQHVHNIARQHRAGIHMSASAAPRDNRRKKQAVSISPYSGRGFGGLTSVIWPASFRLQSLPVRQPEMVDGGLPFPDSNGRAGNLARAIDPVPSSLQNFAARQRGDGIGGYFWIFARPPAPATDPKSRNGGTTIANGQYGGSQIGAILSYPILTEADPVLAVYGRVSAALTPFAQEELALGARIHPVHNLPFSFHAEQRLSADSGRNRGAAFYVAGGTGPEPVVEKITLETYAQTGYVLGDDETYFFDGSATLQRPITESGPKKLSVGAGVWAGGQRNIARLDVGPRADFAVPLGTGSARLAIDWRVRVAGDALPASGVAITLSTGF